MPEELTAAEAELSVLAVFQSVPRIWPAEVPAWAAVLMNFWLPGLVLRL